MEKSPKNSNEDITDFDKNNDELEELEENQSDEEEQQEKIKVKDFFTKEKKKIIIRKQKHEDSVIKSAFELKLMIGSQNTSGALHIKIA